MIALRRADARGHFDFGWLDTRHTFSFGEYYDPNQMGFRTLRVINEDRVQPGRGFPAHGHRDMEIISYVLVGALQPRHTPHAWVQVARGAVTLDSQPLWHGDGAAVSAQPSLRLIGVELAEVLVFDLA